MPVQRLMAIYPAFVDTQSGGLINVAIPRAARAAKKKNLEKLDDGAKWKVITTLHLGTINVCTKLYGYYIADQS